MKLSNLHIEAKRPLSVRQTEATKEREDKPIAPLHGSVVARLFGEALHMPVTSDSCASMLETRRIAGDMASGKTDKRELRENILAMVTARFSPESQQDLIAFLDKNCPESKDLAPVIGQLRRIPGRSGDVPLLRDYLLERGYRLGLGDGANDKITFSVNRWAFRKELKRLESEGGVLTKRDVRGLLAQLKGVEDQDDLQWAQWEIKRRFADGNFTCAEPTLLNKFENFFADVLPSTLNKREIGSCVNKLKKDGFSAEAVDDFLGRLETGTSDSDTLFFAERILSRQIVRAKNKAKKAGDSDAVAAHESMLERVEGFFAPKLKGQFDRHAMLLNINRMRRKGEIDKHQSVALSAVAATSASTDDFAEGLMTMQLRLGFAATMQEMQEAYDDFLDSYSRNMSDDTYDASGNLLETADERFVKQMLKERQVKELTLKPQKTEELALRSWYRANRSQAQSRVASAVSVSEKQSAHRDLAQVNNADTDLERVAI
ncbi:MAG: hypothetical protein QGI45_12340 [Myxococcota bacterium]|nr:hypothetical protein [Myxococcota bacterium]